MKSNIKNILNNISNKNPEVISEKKQIEIDKAYKLLDRLEIEKNKTEPQKIHERYLRQIKRMASPPDLNIREAKPRQSKPGIEFEGVLRVLAEKYETIEEIYKHLTLGQLSKYYQIERCLYRHKDGMLVYDEEKRECYE